MIASSIAQRQQRPRWNAVLDPLGSRGESGRVVAFRQRALDLLQLLYHPILPDVTAYLTAQGQTLGKCLFRFIQRRFEVLRDERVYLVPSIMPASCRSRLNSAATWPSNSAARRLASRVLPVLNCGLSLGGRLRDTYPEARRCTGMCTSCCTWGAQAVHHAIGGCSIYPIFPGFPRIPAGYSIRLGSESNRRRRLCRPLHDHSAT